MVFSKALKVTKSTWVAPNPPIYIIRLIEQKQENVKCWILILVSDIYWIMVVLKTDRNPVHEISRVPAVYTFNDIMDDSLPLLSALITFYGSKDKFIVNIY